MFLAALSGIVVWQQKPLERKDLTAWCFSENHAKAYTDPSLKAFFLDHEHLTYEVTLMSQQSEDIRLVSMFMSSPREGDSPDLCEIEISSIGKYLRPPVADVGLRPLNDLLDRSGWRGRIVQSRFAPWSKVDPKSGKTFIFGVPCDVNPVSLTYRKDLFDEAGQDPQKAKTWPQFQQICLDFQKYRAAHGHRGSQAMALTTITQGDIVTMLLQRHINVIDANNQVHLNDPRLLDTLVFFAGMASGNRQIGADPSPGVGWTKDISDGTYAAVLTADWSANYLERYAPELKGKVRMMPLPRFEDSDAPTSTQGGTMMGIPRTSPNPERAWKLIELLSLSPQATASRIAHGNRTLPAAPELWNDPVYHQPNPFFADDTPDGPGQKISELFVNLASQIPERYITPYTFTAEMALVAVLQNAKDYLHAHPNGEGLKPAVAAWLAEAQTAVEERMKFAGFEQ